MASAASFSELMTDLALLLVRIYSDFLLLVFLLFIRIPINIFKQIFALFLNDGEKPRKFESILITGASVGLGAALAEEFAGPGVIMTITAKSSEAACSQTKKLCEEKGAICEVRVADVCDSKAMRKIIEEAHSRKPLDLVIANAGITASVNGLSEAPSVLETNTVGVANTIYPAIELMLKQVDRDGHKPHLVLMSSLGGHTSAGSVFMSSYAASKNAVRILGETLRVALSPKIGVTVLCPGMTESRLVSRQISQGVHMRTGVWPVRKATKLMAKGIRENRAEVSYPSLWYIIGKTYGGTPTWFKELAIPITKKGDPFYVQDQVIWDYSKEE
jgi:short-subunit dehydrogenase